MTVVIPNTKTDRTASAPGSADVWALVATKLRCITPMIAIYVTAYLGLAILSGFAKPLLGTKVLGPVNLGFVMIALNYLVAWVLAVIYARVANRVHDLLVQESWREQITTAEDHERHHNRHIRGDHHP